MCSESSFSATSAWRAAREDWDTASPSQSRPSHSRPSVMACLAASVERARSVSSILSRKRPPQCLA